MREPFSKQRTGQWWAVVAALGIIAIAGLEFFALSQGINGQVLTGALVAIAALGGTSVGKWLKK